MVAAASSRMTAPAAGTVVSRPVEAKLRPPVDNPLPLADDVPLLLADDDEVPCWLDPLSGEPFVGSLVPLTTGEAAGGTNSSGPEICRAMTPAEVCLLLLTLLLVTQVAVQPSE